MVRRSGRYPYMESKQTMANKVLSVEALALSLFNSTEKQVEAFRATFTAEGPDTFKERRARFINAWAKLAAGRREKAGKPADSALDVAAATGAFTRFANLAEVKDPNRKERETTAQEAETLDLSVAALTTAYQAANYALCFKIVRAAEKAAKAAAAK